MAGGVAPVLVPRLWPCGPYHCGELLASLGPDLGTVSQGPRFRPWGFGEARPGGRAPWRSLGSPGLALGAVREKLPQPLDTREAAAAGTCPQLLWPFPCGV